jgi:oligoendopeptidase F
MQKYKSRNDVPDKYKWDLTAFFKNDEEFNKAFKDSETRIKKIKDYVGCTKDANKLYEFLEFSTTTESVVENLYVYAYLLNDQELGISKNMERKAKAEDLMNNYEVSVSFFEPELLELTKEEYEKLYVTNPKLNEHKPSLSRIYRKKEHVLSEREEQIVTELCNAMDHFDDM